MRALFVFFVLTNTLQLYAQSFRVDVNETIGTTASYDNMLSRVINIPTATKKEAWIIIKSNISAESELIYVYINGNKIDRLAGDGRGSSYIAFKLMPWRLKQGDNEIKIVVNNILSNAEIQWIQIIQDPQDKSGGRYLTEHRFYSSYYEDNLFVDYFKIKCLTELAGKTPATNTFCVNMGYIEGAIGYRMKEKNISYNVATSKLSNFKLAQNWGLSSQYYLTGILMDASENVLDVREYEFKYDNINGPDPFGMRFAQDNYGLTNGSVKISVTDFFNFDGRTVNHFELPDGSVVNDVNNLVYSASSNGTYTFKVVSGGSSYSFTHTVSNIDKTAPVISLLGENPMSVLEGTTYSEPGYSVSDNASFPQASDVVSNAINTDDVSTQIITYKLTDDAGNLGTINRTINIIPQPLTVVTNAENQSLPNVTFNGTLQYLGSSAITAHGFVWGMLEYPSLDFCLASKNLGAKSTKGNFSYSINSFQQGETYYVRAYATNADGETIYGEQKKIVYVGANYGSIQLENTNYSVSRSAGNLNVNINRTGGSDGTVSCSYILYDGSALSGTHYTHKSGTLSFAEGETQKTISIPITNNTGAIGDRQFYIQLYNPQGGVALGTNTFATVTIDYNPVHATIVQYQPNSAGNKTLIYNAFGPDSYGDGVSCDDGWSKSGGDWISKGCNDNFELDGSTCTFTTKATDISSYVWNPDLRMNATIWYSLNDWGDNDYAEFRVQMSSDNGSTYSNSGTMISKTSGSGTITMVSGKTINEKTTHVRFQLYRRRDGSGNKLKWNEVRVTLWDNIAPSFSSITAGSRTYTLGEYVYFSVKFREQVYVTGSPRLELNLNGTTKYADYYTGSGCDVLVFRYKVTNGDDCRSTKVNSTTINLNGGTIKDLYGNNTSLSTTSQSLNQTSSVYIDGRVPAINFAANTSRTTWKTNHTQTVTLSNASSKKYVWTQQTTTPQKGWQTFTENTKTFNIQGVSGNNWYLHIFAAHSNGNTVSKYVGPFYLDNTAPEITLSPSAIDAWTNNNVNISVTGSDLQSGVSSITSSSSLTGSGTNPKSFTVTQNGTYTFSVTDNVGLVSEQSITIDKIEKELPVISASQTSSNDSWVTNGSSIISIEDMPVDLTLQSGIASSQYCWTSSSSAPSSGWQDLPELTGGAIKDEAGITGNRYFHIKCTDNAGNVAYLNSGIFKTVNNTPPTLNINTNISPSVWTKERIVATVTGAAQVAGLNLARVSLPTYTNDDDIVISEQTNIDLNQNSVSKTFDIDKSGYYEVTLFDEAGNSAKEILIIDKIDTDAPSINISNSSNGEWTNLPVTINATVTDNTTPIFDASGEFTGNSGSGINTATVTSNGNTVDFSGGFTTSVTTSPTTFTFYAEDNVGNSTTYEFTVNNIDTNNPMVATTNNNFNWQISNFEVPLTFTDSESGIAHEQFAVTTSETTPGSYTTYSSPISFTTNGIFYLHYKAVDFAGNEKTGYFGPYKLDKTAPSDFSPIASNIGSSDITITGTSSDDVSGLHATESYRFAKNENYGDWQTGNQFHYSSLTPNANYSFKMMAKNNAGLTTETSTINKYTLALDPTVAVASAQSTQLKFDVQHNATNQSVPYCYYELKKAGAGATGPNVQMLNWTNTTSLTFSGLTAGTHYELWVTTRNQNNVENQKFLAVSDAVTNRPPAATNESYNIYKGHTLTVTGKGVLANDTDPDGNALSAVLQTSINAAAGTLHFNTNGTFTFTPADGFTGTASFTYKANDGFTNSENLATVTIQVVIPTWNGTGEYTVLSNWNGKELPVATDEILVQSGTMSVSSTLQYAKIIVTGGVVNVKNSGVLTLGECDYSGNTLKAENGGIIKINGNILSGNSEKIRIKSGVSVKSGIKLPVNSK